MSYTQFTSLKNRIKKELDFLFLLSQLKIKIYPGNMIFSIYKDEQNPSLHIYLETNTYYCFASDKGGDIIRFYMDLRKLRFKEAVIDLNDILSAQKLDNQHVDVRGMVKKERLIQLKIGEYHLYDKLRKVLKANRFEPDRINKTASKLFMCRRQNNCNRIFNYIEEIYYSRGMSDEVFNYLTGRERNLTIETIRKFRIIELDNPWFYANNLKRYFSKEQLISSGIYNDKCHFIFGLHKILIPYIKNNKVILIRGRRFPESEKVKAKYIGLAGLNAKRIFNVDVLNKLKKGDKIIICEGEFDTMIADQAGFNAIGIPGVTNIPINELEKLNIGQYDICLAFDNDIAGDKAVQLFVNEVGVSVKRLKYNTGKDLTEACNGN